MTKSLFKYFVFTGFLAMTLIGCDKVEDYVVITDQQLTTDDRLDTLYTVDSISVKTKQVLFEEFTGHLCSNCPTQSLAAHELAEELDHRLVIVGIHAGGFSNLEPPLYTIDFTCPTGVKIHDDYQVNFYPSGLINRIVYGPSSVIPPQFWETIITDELDKPNVVDLSLQTYYYPNLKTIEINVLAEFKQQLEGKYKLSLYLVEDNIVAYQKNDNEELGPEDIPDYHHRNVLRDAVNGTYGVYVSDDGSITASVPYAQKFIYSDFSENWNIGNCKIIAFVYGEETDEVLQVAELAIHTGE